MRYFIKRIYDILARLGLDPLKTIRFIRGIPFFIKDLVVFYKQKNKSEFKDSFHFGLPYPILDERFSDGGSASGHYFHQDLLVAQRIFYNSPKIHLDIGSRVDGFVAHVASFRKIEVLDIRPTNGEVNNIQFMTADLMNLDEKLVNYCDSLSCLHALEHFGLGRYSDPINFDGYLDGLESMYKILKKSGKFYFSVPIGKQRIEFNAHRVFSVNYLITLFINKFEIDSFSFVDDKGALHKNVEMLTSKNDINYGCNLGCGIFEMTKL